MASSGDYGDYDEKPSERSRWTPLTRMLLSGEMTQERQKELSAREKFDRWMVNEGYRRMYGFRSETGPAKQCPLGVSH